MKQRKVQLPTMSMRADFLPQSYNKEKRTIDLTWSVGAKGLRSPWFGDPYYEELDMSSSSCRMKRLESGRAPFLDSHMGGSSRTVVGVVESASIENGVGKATVRLSDTPDVADTVRKIETGIVRNISVGYNVYRYERQPMLEGEDIPTYRAVDWEPIELSCVSMGFDDAAATRDGKSQDGVACVFVNNLPERNEEVREMTVKETPVATSQPVDVEQEKKRAAEEAKALAKKAEKERQAEIRRICSKMGMPEAFTERMVNEDHELDKVRELVIDEKAKESKATETRTAVSATGGAPSQIAERKVGLENAMLHRANPSKIVLTDAGRNFRGMSLLEMARDCLEASGINTRGMVKMDLATRAFTSSSDFPDVLANVANKTLRQGYDEAPRTFMGWAKQAMLPDFKQVSRTQLGEAPQLEIVKEDGEITRGTIGQGAEKYQLATYAKVFSISRQSIINDDLNAFANVPSKFGYAAASLESDVVYAILTANAALMVDSVALFHSTHRNLGTAAALSVTSLAEARKLMRRQKGIDGKRLLNIQPQFVIVPAALELQVEQILHGLIVATQTSNVNPYINKLTPVIDPRLDDASATAWYVSASPGQIDTVEYGYLEGQSGVYSETKMGFNVDGIEIKARLDFAAKALDFRGLVKNAGA